MLIFQLPTWLQRFFGGFTWRRSPDSKTVYLTFDDGPVPQVTPKVLDVLDSFGAKATFFCVGENAWRYPALLDDIRRRGHAVGNHTYNHMQGMRHGIRTYIANVEKAERILQSRLFRPPHGRLKHSQKEALLMKYEIIQWDVLTHDYNRHFSPAFILWGIRRHVRNGSIITFHDSVKSAERTLAVLPVALQWLQEQGYQFGLLDEHEHHSALEIKQQAVQQTAAELLDRDPDTSPIRTS
ncbi:MAG: polysaccharide deacetylase family protein [Paludibacteraceae bacterium]|nr:polysaccharide deacetylase family protein [Paludibacteraceae bacterium]